MKKNSEKTQAGPSRPALTTAGAPKKRNPAYTITLGAMIAALYVVLTNILLQSSP